MTQHDLFSSVFSSVNLGEPEHARGWALFPLYPKAAPRRHLCTVHGAVARGIARVEELPSGPSVRELHLVNEGDLPVLVREGDLFVAGRQDRIADRPAVVLPGRSATIPVSCVEQRRWAVTDRADFGVSDTSADLAVRHRRMGLARGGASPDQSATWKLVGERRHAAGLAQPDGSLLEAQARQNDAATTAAAALTPVYGATGLVLCRNTPKGARVALAEWFADPGACADAWTGIVRAVLASGSSGGPVTISRTELRAYFHRVAKYARWEQPDTGLGALIGMEHGSTNARLLALDGIPLYVAILRT